MQNRRRVLVLVAAVGLLLTSCIKSKREAPAIIFGTDTIMAAQLAALDPSGANDSARLRNVAARIVCAGGLRGRPIDSLISGFRERVLLVSGTELDPLAAELLLNAAQHLITRLEGAEKPCAATEQLYDSLRLAAIKILTTPEAASQWPRLVCDTIDPTSRQGKIWLMAVVLGLPHALADLLVEFIIPPELQDTSADINALKELVSGLVFSPASTNKQPLPRKTVASRTSANQQSRKMLENSAEALRYRTVQSIRDSIDKHIPNLRQLYKKSLKENPAIAGKVVMTIRVEAGGGVIGVDVKTTEIGNAAFLGPLVAYVRTMRFQPIPEKIGSMTFDFPFEFHPEM